MGFPRKRLYRLQFRTGDPITDGLEVKAAAPTLLNRLAAQGAKQREGESDREWFDRQYGPLIEAIKSWNIEDEDKQPLPITLDDWYTIDLPVQMRIYTAWSRLEEVIEDESPLGEASGPESPSGSTTGPDPSIEAGIHAQALT